MHNERRDAPIKGKYEREKARAEIKSLYGRCDKTRRDWFDLHVEDFKANWKAARRWDPENRFPPDVLAYELLFVRKLSGVSQSHSRAHRGEPIKQENRLGKPKYGKVALLSKAPRVTE